MSDVYLCDVCDSLQSGDPAIEGFRSTQIEDDYSGYREVLSPGGFDMCVDCARDALEGIHERGRHLESYDV